MSEAARYLSSLAQALAKMSLYAAGHPARAGAADASFEQLRQLQQVDSQPVFSFLGREVIYQRCAVREMDDWDWGERLSNAGVQRLEFVGNVSPEEYRVFLDDVSTRIGLVLSAALTASLPPSSHSPAIRFGPIGVRHELDGTPPPTESGERPDESPDLSVEAEAVEWMHGEVLANVRLPVAEAELVVTSLAHAMHGDQSLLLPLLALKEFDQYTTTHALNVAVLAMGLAEQLGLAGREVRAYGLAGLLHDLGKVRVPHEILRNPGRLTAEEMTIMRNHPVDGARIILNGLPKHETCAVVAFEHHIQIDGSGYPERAARRRCHHASLLVHVCDVFDALRTNRPYRGAWLTPAILGYIERRIGSEFDVDAARAFIKMISERETHVARARAIDFSIPAPALI